MIDSSQLKQIRLLPVLQSAYIQNSSRLRFDSFFTAKVPIEISKTYKVNVTSHFGIGAIFADNNAEELPSAPESMVSKEQKQIAGYFGLMPSSIGNGWSSMVNAGEVICRISHPQPRIRSSHSLSEKRPSRWQSVSMVSSPECLIRYT